MIQGMKMMSTLPLLVSIGVLVTPARLCQSLLVQPRHNEPHRQLILTISPTPARNLALFSTAQAPIISRIDETVHASYTYDNPILDHRQILINEIGSAFAQKMFELEDFQRKHGHCLVPKRYQSNPSLGNWVNKQRQNYRKFLMGENTALNEVCLYAIIHTIYKFRWQV
jgi:hypothetical protein